MDGEIRVLLKSFEEKIDKLIDGMFGNGNAGLMIRVDRIEQKEKDRKDLTIRLDRLEQKANRKSKLIWLITGGGIIALATAVATAICS